MDAIARSLFLVAVGTVVAVFIYMQMGEYV